MTGVLFTNSIAIWSSLSKYSDWFGCSNTADILALLTRLSSRIMQSNLQTYLPKKNTKNGSQIQ
jgi:hypothetical protein